MQAKHDVMGLRATTLSVSGLAHATVRRTSEATDEEETSEAAA